MNMKQMAFTSRRSKLVEFQPNQTFWTNLQSYHKWWYCKWCNLAWKITEHLKDFKTPENDHGPPPEKKTHFFQGTSSSFDSPPFFGIPASHYLSSSPVLSWLQTPCGPDVSQGMMRALTQEQKDEVLKHDECQKESLFSGPILGGSS